MFLIIFLSRLEGSIQPESLKMLLDYTLARGNLKSIFKVLKLLYGKYDFLSFLIYTLFLDYLFEVLYLFIYFFLLICLQQVLSSSLDHFGVNVLVNFVLFRNCS